ncbi:hypothetical protein [Planobispora takensis]|uniref:Uncharacterized protein n=1 Tax=Planobispora takensis TaxID=1367882 RepID=A0A8J3WUX8_9ACTN|nr:hypothetical protein [Planobispora takensis]GII03384.1 hypothetical protein Pta02_53920 [Planobispora takensis]
MTPLPADEALPHLPRRLRPTPEPHGGPLRRPARVLLPCALLVPALAACTAGTGSAAAPTPTPTGQNRQQLITALKDVAACFRQNGVPGAGDPEVEADGSVGIPGVPDPIPAAAQTACAPLERRAAAVGKGGGEERYTAAQIAQLRKLARCFREHGVHDWPDPDAEGRFRVNQRLADLGKRAWLPARAACKQYFVGRGIPVVEPGDGNKGD